MRRPPPQEIEGAGQDSFLDVLANIVGILIILVMVAGVRAKQYPATVPPPADGAASERRAQDEAAAAALAAEIATSQRQIGALGAEAAVRSVERSRLALAAATAERQLMARRGTLDEASRQIVDLQLKVNAAREELAEIDRQRAALVEVEPETVVVESYPTPIAKQIEGEKLYFQLAAGRLAHIPLDKLKERFTADAKRNIDKLRTMPEITGTVGPEGGFRLKYVVRARKVGGPVGEMVVGAEVALMTLIPTAETFGEPLDAALTEGSDFHRTLAQYPPAQATVVLFTYTDSSEEFRRLRKLLYTHGYRVAPALLPPGTPIGFAPEGTSLVVE